MNVPDNEIHRWRQAIWGRDLDPIGKWDHDMYTRNRDYFTKEEPHDGS